MRLEMLSGFAENKRYMQTMNTNILRTSQFRPVLSSQVRLLLFYLCAMPCYFPSSFYLLMSTHRYQRVSQAQAQTEAQAQGARSSFPRDQKICLCYGMSSSLDWMSRNQRESTLLQRGEQKKTSVTTVIAISFGGLLICLSRGGTVPTVLLIWFMKFMGRSHQLLKYWIHWQWTKKQVLIGLDKENLIMRVGKAWVNGEE